LQKKRKLYIIYVTGEKVSDGGSGGRFFPKTVLNKKEGEQRMKKLVALLAGVTAACGTVGVVLADDQEVTVSLAEIGAVEQPEHPVPFGQCGIWELSINKFQASGKNESLIMTTSQLARLMEIGSIRVKATVTEGGELLESGPLVVREDDSAVLRMTIEHTYGTKEEKVEAEITFTAVRNIYWDKEQREFTRSLRNSEGERNTLILEKGDILISQPVEFTAHYNNLESYQAKIRLNEDAINDRQVLADGEELYMASGKDKMLTLEFGDIAAYTTCISAAQKTVNLFYTLDEIEDISEVYPDCSFHFISFPGNPSFINSGELSFQAVGGENTVVYSYEDGELTRLESEYDSTYDRAVVRSVKRLGSYVVASESIDDYAEIQEEINSNLPQAVRIVLKK